MSADHLTALEHAALAVLTGTPAPEAAAHAMLGIAEVTRAAERYRAAGQAALTSLHANDWYQASIEFADPSIAERTFATVLLPRLQHAHSDGALRSWWYIRKTPHWRLRCQAHREGTEPLRQLVTSALDDLTSQQQITTWTEGVYEPEAHAFGGQKAMDVAHRFFHDDSVNTLTQLARTGFQPSHDPTPLGLRELSLLTCSTLLRAAGQDWHEQGDVWQRVAQMRTLDPTAPIDRLHSLADKLHQILALDIKAATATQENGQLTGVQSWLAAANTAGEDLRDLARLGDLHRGLRDVLAHHIIFHWNRLGLTHAQQATLAHATAITILGPPAKIADRYPIRNADVAGA